MTMHLLKGMGKGGRGGQEEGGREGTHLCGGEEQGGGEGGREGMHAPVHHPAVMRNGVE